MVNLNDEIFGRLTHSTQEGDIVLGVPHDIVYPLIPQVMQRFARDFPKMRLILQSSFTWILKDQFSRGECDLILTTETELDAGGELLAEWQLVWIGAPDGLAWKLRPLPLADEQACIFRQSVQAALDQAGVSWKMAVISQNTGSVEATVSADLAVHTRVGRVRAAPWRADRPRRRFARFVADEGRVVSFGNRWPRAPSPGRTVAAKLRRAACAWPVHCGREIPNTAASGRPCQWPDGCAAGPGPDAGR